MHSKEFQGNFDVLFLNENPSLVSLLTDVFALEGISMAVATTAAQVFSLLSTHSGNSVVLIDNLQVHPEGREFLEQLRHEPTLRPQLRAICIAVHHTCIGVQKDFGDVFDAYLELPFTVPQLLEVMQVT